MTVFSESRRARGDYEMLTRLFGGDNSTLAKRETEGSSTREKESWQRPLHRNNFE